MKYFYTHLVEIESVIEELDNLDLSSEQKVHLASLIDSSLHHTILDAIFSELAESDKKVLLNFLKMDDHYQTWKFLNEKVDGIEEKIKKVAEDLIVELKKDLKEAQIGKNR